MRKYLIRIFGLVVVMLISCSDSEVPTTPDGQLGNDTIPTGPPNNPPVIFDHPDTSATVGVAIYFWPTAYDEDGDSLIYDGFVNSSLSDFRRGTVPVYAFIEEINALKFTPRAYDSPRRRVYLMVHDGRGGSDTTRFSVSIE